MDKMTNLDFYPCFSCGKQFENVNQAEYPDQVGFVRSKHLATFMEIELGILYLVSDYHSKWNGSVFQVKHKSKRMQYDEVALFCDDCVEKMLEKDMLEPIVLYKHNDPYQLDFGSYLVNYW